MKTFYAMLLFLGVCACDDNLKNFIEVADSSIQNGVGLKMGKPILVYKNDFYSSEEVQLEVTNLSSDTIYFVNIFVFKDDHPVWGNFEFHISDEHGNSYFLQPSSRHYYEMTQRQTEYVILPPGASYQDSLSISFDLDYHLSKGKTYTIFAQYVNQRIFDTGTFPIRLPAGKQLWTGVLKSNTYKFKL
jgi:hypothetical protein